MPEGTGPARSQLRVGVQPPLPGFRIDVITPSPDALPVANANMLTYRVRPLRIAQRSESGHMSSARRTWPSG